MREQIETEKSLSQLKKFVIREMKNQNADWINKFKTYSSNQEGFKSEYLKILRDVKVKKDDPRDGDDVEITPYRIYLRNGDLDYVYELNDIGLSKIRFYFLLYYVKRFCKRREELQRKERLAFHWENFLKKNKVLDRDRKIDEILK